MEKKEQLYESKTKKVYAADELEYIIVEYKDCLSNWISRELIQVLQKHGIPTYFVKQLSEREAVVKRVQLIPLKIIVRNVVAGSLSTRIGQPEGTRLTSTILEYNYKNDALGDPMINQFHAFALRLCTPEELTVMTRYAFEINDILKVFLREIGIDLIDFKLEFGRLPDGTLVLADEISPDTCRLWDAETGKKLNKNRVRWDTEGTACQDTLRRFLENKGIV